MNPTSLVRIGQAGPHDPIEHQLDFVPNDYWDAVGQLTGGSINDSYSIEDPNRLQLLRESTYANPAAHPDAVIFSRSSFTRMVFCWAPPRVQLDVGAEPDELEANDATFLGWLERVSRGDLAPAGVVRPFWLSRSASSVVTEWLALLPRAHDACLTELTAVLESEGNPLLRRVVGASWFSFDDQQAILSTTAFEVDPDSRAPDARIVLRASHQGSSDALERLLEELGWVVERT